EIACNYLVQHRRDMLSACWRKLLILLASPAGFEPATCGLEIRCCYPTELRGRDGQAFTPRSPSSASAATAGFCRTARRSAACAACRPLLDFLSSRFSRSVRNWVIFPAKDRKHAREAPCPRFAGHNFGSRRPVPPIGREPMIAVRRLGHATLTTPDIDRQV